MRSHSLIRPISKPNSDVLCLVLPVFTPNTLGDLVTKTESDLIIGDLSAAEGSGAIDLGKGLHSVTTCDPIAQQSR
jgi:hypothetical protein